MRLSTRLPGLEPQYADGLVIAGPVMLMDCWTFQTPEGNFNKPLGPPLGNGSISPNNGELMIGFPMNGCRMAVDYRRGG